VKVILEEKVDKDAQGKIIGTLRVEVYTETLWEGWEPEPGVKVPGLKTLPTKTERVDQLKKWGYKANHIKKLRDSGLDG